MGWKGNVDKAGPEGALHIYKQKQLHEQITQIKNLFEIHFETEFSQINGRKSHNWHHCYR